jgi:hypothetical protein
MILDSGSGEAGPSPIRAIHGSTSLCPRDEVEHSRLCAYARATTARCGNAQPVQAAADTHFSEMPVDWFDLWPNGHQDTASAKAKQYAHW